MKNYKINLILVFFAIIVFAGCGEQKDEKQVEEQEETSKIIRLSKTAVMEINLETSLISLMPLTGSLTLPAKVVTNQNNEALIGSLVQGRVHKVFVNVGDFVRVGQVMMTVEGLDVGQIKAGFMKSKATYEFTMANYERQKKLFDENVGSGKAVLESKAEYEKALAEYKAEDKKIHSVGLSDEDIISANANDEHTSGTLPIKASISGVVVERNVVIGQLVDAATNAFRIINTQSVWVDGQIYEKDILKISQKTSAEFTSSSFQNVIFRGTLTYIGQTVDEHSRTITVRGTFRNPDNRLKPQMFGELKIPVGTNAKAILIPEDAIVRETKLAYVFVAANDTTFEQRIIVTGISVDKQVEVREGLKEGERIVTKGVFYLKSELKKDEIGGEE